MPILTVCCPVGISFAKLLSPLLDGISKHFEYGFRVFPSYACIRDRNTVFEAGFAFGWNFLAAY